MTIRVVQSSPPGRAHRPGHRLGLCRSREAFFVGLSGYIISRFPFLSTFPLLGRIVQFGTPLSPPVLPGSSQPLLPLPQRAQLLEDPAHPHRCPDHLFPLSDGPLGRFWRDGGGPGRKLFLFYKTLGFRKRMTGGFWRRTGSDCRSGGRRWRTRRSIRSRTRSFLR